MAAGRLTLVALWFFLAIIASPREAEASFLNNNQGAKAIGMAGAFAAQADDPSAVFYNPAGIHQLPGTQISVGLQAVMARASFQSDGNPLMGTLPGETGHTKERIVLIPNGYITSKLSDRVSIGLGMYSPFGLSVDWPRDFEGRFSLGGLRTTLQTISVSPVVAVEPIKRLSFGVGPYFQYVDADVRNLAFIAPPVPPLSPTQNGAVSATSKLTGNNWGVGWTLGFLYRITDNVSVGASYLSQVRHDVNDVRQELTRIADGAAILTRRATTELTLPAVLRFGAAWKGGAWTIEADGQWTQWSSYRELRVDFSNGTSIVSPKHWHDSWNLRLGGQYRLNRYLDLRAGFAWEESPIPGTTLDPMLPSGNRNIYCLGLGVHLPPFTIDLAYNYLDDSSRRWNNPSGDVKVGGATVTRVTGGFNNVSAHFAVVNFTFGF